MRTTLLLLLLSACESAPPPPPAVCGGWEPETVHLVAGGRARIAIDPDADVESIAAGASFEAYPDGTSIIVRAGYQAASDALTVSCGSGDIEVPIEIEPLRFEPLLEWDTDGPGAREYFAWWMGAPGERALYLFGGFVYEPVQFTPSDELWRLDLGTLAWAQLTPTGAAPPPGGRVVRAWDDDVYYFGGAGVDAGGALDTPPVLSTIDATAGGAAWSDAPNAESAPGSYTGSLIYDEARDRLLSVCGVDTRVIAAIHCRVEEYTADAGFTPVEVEGDAPPGRYGFHYVHDVENDRVIIFGGQDGLTNADIAGDAWALELAPDGDAAHPRWTRLFESSEGISPRRNGAFALDPENERMIVWGGTADGMTAVPGLEVLSLDRGHERWTHVELPAEVHPRASGGGVYDAEAHRILFGFGNESELYTDLFEMALAPTD